MAKHPVTCNGGHSEISPPRTPATQATLSCHMSPGKQEARGMVGLGWGDQSWSRPPDTARPKPNPPSTTQGLPPIWIQVVRIFREAHRDHLTPAHSSKAPCLLVLITSISAAT